MWSSYLRHITVFFLLIDLFSLLTWSISSLFNGNIILIKKCFDFVFRVYDNAQANAVMQKALMTLSIWESMTSSRRNAFYHYMETSCNPFKEYYDDDMTEEGEEDMKKVTIQIKVREPLCVRRVQ